jgi:hypothetical protein
MLKAVIQNMNLALKLSLGEHTCLVSALANNYWAAKSAGNKQRLVAELGR